MKLKVLTYNTLYAGRDGRSDARAHAQIKLINDIVPDVFLMQEAKGFESNGFAWLYDLESSIGMRGFLAIAPHTGQNVAIFVRQPFRPISFMTDGVHFHHAVATLKIALPGGSEQDPVFTLTSAHLCPNAASLRLSEAAYLAVQADPGGFSLLTGDFNSVSPHDPEPVGFDTLAAHHRSRYIADDMRTADRRVLAHLEAAGLVDIGHMLNVNGSMLPTVPTTGFTETEFPVMRCDYVLASQALAPYAVSYEVIKNSVTDTASDHYPVLVTFEVPQ